ncbi:HBS1-like protein isoform X1 [Centruroides sculpturatus]|uniref:HBS1-like protein isoform X1 n=2 Tax=Centruroides sculpturatus TaxID=218467 RepID=UPI000C6DD7E1|nr:HBS1-like protein isoform X1 [Centruroides sculpturatus]
MSRHRSVRTMNYDDEYEGYYDEYGHSVEEEFCISPSTAAQFMYDRNSKSHSMSAFLNPEDVKELHEEETEKISRTDSFSTPNSKISQSDQVKLNACVEAMQNVVGETIPESTLRTAAVNSNYNSELALQAVLFPTNEPPKPQRIPRQRNRDRQSNKDEEKKLLEVDNQVITKIEETPKKEVSNQFVQMNTPKDENEKNHVSTSIQTAKICEEDSILLEKEKLDVITETSATTNEVIPTQKPKSKKNEKDILLEYQKERGGEKSLINMVVIGHVDAGKSTLMGHLLYRLNFVGKKTIHKYEQESKKLGKASFVYAWVLDETNEERTRGITMDVAQSRFETTHHVITLLDAPGHKDFIPNMITGASQADVAVLVVDATRGEFETGFDAGGQTREHTMLVRSLGVSQLAIAVNKLDNVDWSKDRYNEIVCKLGVFLKQAGFRESDVTFVPCSGLTGENLTESAQNSLLTSWYKGPCLVEVIDKFKTPERPVGKPFRLSVGDVYKGMGSGFSVSGRIEAGYVQTGDRVVIMPAGEPATVKGISIEENSVLQAFAGDHVGLSLLGADMNKITIGSIACDPNNPIQVTTRFQARIVVFGIEIPITKGFPVILHYQSMSEQAVVKKLISQLHKSTGQVVKKKPRCLTKNSSAIIELEVNRPVCLELYKDLRELGRFMLRCGGTTIAAGVVTDIL